MTHAKKGTFAVLFGISYKIIDCTERPRKVGAKFNGKDIQGDEIIQDFDFDYDAKRDRWNGFDSNMFMEVMKEYEKLDDIRKDKRQEELTSKKPLLIVHTNNSL